MARKPPRSPEDRLLRWSRSMIPGTVTGRVAAASPLALDASRLDATLRGGPGAPNPTGGSGDDCYRDRYPLTAAGAQDLALTYLPKPYSEHVYLNGLEQDEGTDWARTDQTLSLLAAMDARADDVLDVRYEYMSGSPTTAQQTGVYGIRSNRAEKLVDGSHAVFQTTPGTDNDISVDTNGPTGTNFVTIYALIDGSGGYLGAQINNGHLYAVVSNPGGTNLGPSYTIAGGELPGTIRTTYDAATGTCRAYLNGTLRSTLVLTSAEQAAIVAPYGVGLSDDDAANIVWFDNVNVNGGDIVDSFNRVDADFLGNADTGQPWGLSG